MVDQKLMLVYEGEVNQAITKAFSNLAEKNMEEFEESTTTKMRVYHVMIECLQNICKHADDIEGESGVKTRAIFVVGKEQNEYFVSTGNVVINEKLPHIEEWVTMVNCLDEDDLKSLYKTRIKEAKISEKGGAGLGLIDIVRKTGNQLEYHFEPLDDNYSFFVLKSKIPRKTKVQVSAIA